MTIYSTPHLAFLQWLPIDSQIHYKLASLCYDYSTAPVYLTKLLRVYKPARRLRALLKFLFSVLALCARSRFVRDFFSPYAAPYRVSGTVSLVRLGHQTHSHL